MRKKNSERTARPNRPRPVKRRRRIGRIIPLLGVIAAVFLCALFLLPREQTLPDRVQQAMPEWVEQQLLPRNPYSRPGTAVKEVHNIVVHYVGNPGTSATANRNYFRNLAITRETYASSNFLVGLEGEILQCVPVNEVAYCSNDRNGDTVSIEVCHPDAEGQFSEETMAALIRLTAWLCSAFDLTAEDVIRHYDVTGKECPRYYVQNPDAWAAFRAAVADAIPNT